MKLFGKEITTMTTYEDRIMIAKFKMFLKGFKNPKLSEKDFDKISDWIEKGATILPRYNIAMKPIIKYIREEITARAKKLKKEKSENE